jgi:hypothetical protein
MIQTREQALKSIQSKLQTSGRHLWSADDDQDSTLIQVDCFDINGQQVILQQQFRKQYTGRKVEYQLISGNLFSQSDVSGRPEDVNRKLDQLLQQESSQRQTA